MIVGEWGDKQHGHVGRVRYDTSDEPHRTDKDKYTAPVPLTAKLTTRASRQHLSMMHEQYSCTSVGCSEVSGVSGQVMAVELVEVVTAAAKGATTDAQ